MVRMFRRKPNNNATIDTLIGPKTRINGDVEFAGGFHLDGYINGNVTCQAAADAFLSVSEHGCIEGSVFAPQVLLNGTVKGNIEGADRVELGAKAQVFGNVAYSVIETAVGAQINGKLIHRAAVSAGEAPGPAEGEPGSQT
jgi:cytoskeletal protein CcmA (bactofilin family)